MSEKDVIKDTRPRMDTVIEDFRRKLATVRTGRAAVSLLDSVMVDYYGTLTPLNQMASSVALLTALRVLLDGEGESSRWIVDAWSQYSMRMPAAVRPDCICATWRGRGDTVSLAVLPTARETTA